MLDIDALGKADGKSWVWHGANCLQPDERRCLIALSDGGEDATTVREFDLTTGAFVPGGFTLPHGKQNIAWEDADHLLVAREWTPGDLTASGYPYIVKRVTRGQPLEAAVEVFRGDKTDTEIVPTALRDGQGHTLATIQLGIDFFHFKTVVVTPQGAKVLTIPAKSGVTDLVAGRAIVKLDEAWTITGKTFPAGAIAALDLGALKADPARLKPTLIWAPGPRESLDQVNATRDHLLLSTLDNVRGRVTVMTPTGHDGWTRQAIAVPDNLAINLGSADLMSNRAFLQMSGVPHPDDPGADRHRDRIARNGQDAAAQIRCLTRCRRTARSDIDRWHENPVFHRPPQGHRLRRHDPDLALCLWRFPDQRDAELQRCNR